MDDMSGYPVIGSVHTLASGGFLTDGCMSVMAGICPKAIGSDAERRGARAQRAVRAQSARPALTTQLSGTALRHNPRLS